MQEPATQNSIATAPCPSRDAGFSLQRERPTWIDFLFAALAFTIYLAWIYRFRYQALLGEDDLYRVLAGLLGGARSGTYLASGNHYGIAFSFGYLAALYRFATPQTLAHPQQLIALINEIGFWSAGAGCFFFWLLAWMLSGIRSATMALILFALSPMMLEVGTSGHPILPAFAFFAAGSCCLLLPVSGLRKVPFAILGGLLLLAALATRAEVLLAFPFVALAGADLGTFARFVKSAGVRALAAALAAAAFFALKAGYVNATPGTGRLLPFLAQYMRWQYIPIGVLVCVLGCGVAATAAGLVAAFITARAFRAKRFPQPPQRTAILHSAAAPLLLIVPALAFWIGDPRPARHFLLCMAGLSILVAALIARAVPLHPVRAYLFALTIVLANQACGALTGPLILKYAPSKLVAVPGSTRPLPRGFPTGTSWGYHRAFEAEELRTDAFAERVRGTCEAKTLVLSLDAIQVFSGLYEGSSTWNEGRKDVNGFPIRTAQIGGRTIAVLSESEGWPRDAAAALLADQQFRDYKFVRDPNNISIYDHAAIPPDRMAHLDCAP